MNEKEHIKMRDVKNVGFGVHFLLHPDGEILPNDVQKVLQEHLCVEEEGDRVVVWGVSE